MFLLGPDVQAGQRGGAPWPAPPAMPHHVVRCIWWCDCVGVLVMCTACGSAGSVVHVGVQGSVVHGTA